MILSVFFFLSPSLPPPPPPVFSLLINETSFSLSFYAALSVEQFFFAEKKSTVIVQPIVVFYVTRQTSTPVRAFQAWRTDEETKVADLSTSRNPNQLLMNKAILDWNNADGSLNLITHVLHAGIRSSKTGEFTLRTTIRNFPTTNRL